MKRYFQYKDNELVGPAFSSKQIGLMKKLGYREVIRLSDKELMWYIEDWLKKEADADTLAEISGIMFGGKCEADIERIPKSDVEEQVYYFEPNEDYGNRFHK